jgi:hypothetical protein
LLVCAVAALAGATTSASGSAQPTPAYMPHPSSAALSHPQQNWRPAFPLGSTVLLAPRTRRLGCTLGVEPDRRCSPGAYYSRATKAVLCSPGFHPSTLQHVTAAATRTVNAEYGLTGSSRAALKIDHIVPLELGGSNNVANLYPQRPSANRLKKTLDSALRGRVCQGLISLAAARQQVAANWELLYTKLNGVGH